MTLPRFQLTRHTTVTCLRKTPGEYVKGKYVEGFEVPFTIEANVQPTKMQEILQMKESDRTRDWITVYSASELQTLEQGDDGKKADIVQWEGKLWEVVKVKHYKMGVLDHYKAVCARLETTLKTSYPESN